MRRRVFVSAPETGMSLTEVLEYGLTVTLVIVVIAALLEICGVSIGLRG